MRCIINTQTISRVILASVLPCFAAGTVWGQEDHAPVGAASESETIAHQASQKRDEEIVEIELSDGVVVKGRLTLPPPESSAEEVTEASSVETLVIYVHGTGPATYLTKRRLDANTEFNYFDYFAEAFADRGIGFFSYNKRGVTNGDTPPWFDEVDRDAFREVVPGVEADDLASIVRALKRHDRVADARVILLGWSEGSIVAALAAERHPELIGAIMLAGYAHDNMYDIIAYQFTGHGSMLVLNPRFDRDDDGTISREEYDSDDEAVARYRTLVMQDATFDLLDATQDGLLTAADFAIRNKPMHTMLLYCVEKNDEEWIWNNYFRISIPWLREHFSLEPNKTRLLRMDLPIYVFHGTNDAHVDVKTVEDLQQRFKVLGKTNLQAHVFPDHDHDLNFIKWVKTGEVSEGIMKMLEVAAAFNAEHE